MSDLPYFKWYPAEAEADALYASMNDQELGFYHRCLNRSWTNTGLPADQGELARVMRVSPTYLRKVWDRVGRCYFPVEDNPARLINPRQEMERALAQHKSEQAADAGRKSQRSLKRMLKARSHSVSLRASESKSESSVICSSEIPSVALNGNSNLAVWLTAGFSGPEDFTVWFQGVYSRHSRRGAPQVAEDGLRNAIFSGALTRSEFEEVYELYKNSPDWKREGGRYVPTLAKFVTDEGWKYPPIVADEDVF